MSLCDPLSVHLYSVAVRTAILINMLPSQAMRVDKLAATCLEFETLYLSVFFLCSLVAIFSVFFFLLPQFYLCDAILHILFMYLFIYE